MRTARRHIGAEVSGPTGSTERYNPKKVIALRSIPALKIAAYCSLSALQEEVLKFNHGYPPLEKPTKIGV
jgi:hypothetical protein